MNFKELLLKHLWVMFILVSFLNAIIFKYRAIRESEKDPSLEKGFNTIIKGFLFFSNIPWIIMGLGIETGSVAAIALFLRPQDGNPYVVGFLISISLLWLLSAYWLFLRGGAEMLARHSAIFNGNLSSPVKWKKFWISALIGGIIALVMIVYVDINLLEFK